MSFLSLIAALFIEQVKPLGPRCTLYRMFTRYVNLLGSHFNAGERRQGVIAWCLAVLPWVIVCIAIYRLLSELHVVFGWAWNVAVLYLTMGFRQFSHSFTEMVEALRMGDLDKARQLLGEWRGESATEYNGTEIAKVAIEEGLIGVHRHVYGVIFWFLVLPGPSGAVLYRLAGVLEHRWGTRFDEEFGEFGQFARRAFYFIDWIPARLTAMGFAIAGDFEDAMHCWRTQATAWLRPEVGIVLASGAGALGVRLGETLHHHGTVSFRPELGLGDEADVNTMTSAMAMAWRALLIWLIVIGLATVARWAG